MLFLGLVSKLFVGPIDPNENFLGELLLCPRVVAIGPIKKGWIVHTQHKMFESFYKIWKNFSL
jgi:hypothetical protein